jgi:hypothetical protein
MTNNQNICIGTENSKCTYGKPGVNFNAGDRLVWTTAPPDNCYIKNKDHQPVYHNKHNEKPIPIMDLNSIKVYLTDVTPNGWYLARDYQIQCYLDYLYFSSSPTDRIEYKPARGITFTIGRNENGSIYYEKDDSNKTRVLISHL